MYQKKSSLCVRSSVAGSKLKLSMWQSFSGGEPESLLAMAARHFCSPAAVRLLLARGADPNRADKEGRTPCMWAAHRGTTACLRALAEGAAQQEDRSLDVNAVRETPPAVREILAKSFFWAESNFEKTALDIAVANSVPGDHDTNAVAEGFVQLVTQGARAVMVTAGAPHE